MIIYYVGLRLSWQSEQNLKEEYSIDGSLHTTLIYSRSWFPYKPNIVPGLIIDPPFYIEYFGELAVLRFSNIVLTERHNELRRLGATWDYDDFKSHISLGKLNNVEPIKHSITFDNEYYMTWDETNARN